MTSTWSAPRKRYAWVVGVLVLAALVGTVIWMLQADERLAARLGKVPPPAAAPVAPPIDAGAISSLTQGPRANADATVRGVVTAPDGRPAGSATVTIYRLTTAWPEWSRRVLDTAYPGLDGAFQFRIEDTRGLLVRVEHRGYADAFAEVPLHGETMAIRLEPGFELFGVVTKHDGAPLPNARVAVESVPGDNRRVEWRVTSASGNFRFEKLPAGPVRLVARHDEWLPATVPAVVVGDQRRVDLRFTRPAMAPWRGRVVVAGAQVEALPINGKLGLVDTRAVSTDGNGEFRLAGLARGSTRLFVRHEAHGAVMTTQTVGVVNAELVVELPPRSTVGGRLVGDSDPPLWRGGEVLRIRDAVGQLDHAVVGSDGSFRFASALSPGWAGVQVLDQPFAFQRSLLAEVDVRIEEGLATHVELGVVAPAVLRGRLVAEDGKPLAGASLHRTKALAEGARTITDAAVQFDLGMFGSQVAQLFASDRDELLATTDKDGAFEIRGQKPGPLLLRAASAGHGTRLLRETVGGVGTARDLGTITLSRGRRMQGVVQRGGRPLVGANVLVVGIDEQAPQAMAVTDARGAWSIDDLMPGDYRVRARLPSKPAGLGLRTERVLASGPPTNVSIVVEAGRTLRGEVVGSDGQPVPGAVVSVRGAAGVAATTTSDANGDFAIELEERATELVVSLVDRSSSTLLPIPAGDERVTVQLDTPPTCTIIASIAGLPGKKRLGAAVLRTTSIEGGVGGETRSRWLETPDGELSWSLCPAGTVRVEVWCDGYAPHVLERDLAANERHDLGDILLEPACRLAGVVVDAAGAPIADALVMVGDEADLDLYESSVRTGPDGAFRISGLSSRSQRVVVRGAGFATRVVDVQWPNDVLRKQPLRIVLEQGATIEVVVARSLAREGGYLQLRRDGRVVANAEVEEDGRTLFANRSAGDYTVHLVGDARSAKPVVVATGAQVVRVHLP
jgi:hypothetical protein